VWSASGMLGRSRKSAFAFASERMPRLEEHKATRDGSARFLIYYRLHGVESLLALVRFLGPSGASPHHRMTPVLSPSRTIS
jgi:hypothetical protein